ncbi:type II-A CRISPR-associated protein Csn2 [Vagococcus bubulae]|uniref:Type II-A CRISPR-associated protein Csn2 n=1 Tax=Vagococcus bubulae TaxID=1977868 RepID=A0A429ZQE4_9ENTE|nr:type II-A CRISPR-associated protein Csn2 [Vagococcus bubulae]RST95940.1 type II-A CRISPR-associated protein Csn2 [Vagococcus bubulae]
MISMNLSILDAPIKINGVVYLVIKDQAYYAEIVKEMYRFDLATKLTLFDSKFKTLKESELLVITDILGFDINSSSIIKLIYSDLEAQLNIDVEAKTKVEYHINQITNLISQEVLEHDLSLTMDEITIQELFKSLGIKVQVNHESIFFKMMEIIEVYKYLTKKKCLIFVNVSSYLSTEELLSINEYIHLSQVDVLFLERHEMIGITNYILDDDFYFYKENVV